jgi:DNA-directed RNA polymerase alpha subunit
MHVGSPAGNDPFINDGLASDDYLARLNLSVRASNILFRLGIKSDEELVHIKPDVLLRQRNCGRKTVAEIMDLIETLPIERVCEPPPPKPHFESDVRCLRLSDSNTDILRKLGIETTGDLSRASDEKLLNAGLWNVAEIRDRLWKFFVLTEEAAILLNDNNPLEYLRLSVRATSGAKTLGITTIRDLAAVQDHEFLKLRNMGRKSIREVHLKMLQYFVCSEFDGDEGQPLPDTPKTLLDEMIGDLPQIQRDVLTRRFGLWNRKPETLQDIGDTRGCTRERIRQIESKALATLNWPVNAKRIQRFLGELFRDHFQPIFQKGPGITTEDELRGVFLSLFASAREGMAAEELISKAFLCDSSIYEECCIKTDDGLFAADENARRKYLAVVRSVQAYLAYVKKPVPLSTLLKAVERNDLGDTSHLSEEAISHFIRMAPRIRTDDAGCFGLAEWRYMRPKTLRDMIVRALVDIGKPAHFTQVAMQVNERFHPSTPLNARNIHARLVYDQDTFVWQSNGVYGLSAWGLKKAPYVKDRLVEILKSAKRPMSLHQLIPKVLETCHCNENTPATILDMHRDLFVRLDKGIYGLKEWDTA